MSALSVRIARCPEHGLHGERQECFVCGASVEGVAMVPVSLLAAAYAAGYCYGAWEQTPSWDPTARDQPAPPTCEEWLAKTGDDAP